MPHTWYPPHSYLPHYANTSTFSSSPQAAPPYFDYSSHAASRYQHQHAEICMLYGHQKPTVTHPDGLAQHAGPKRKRRKKSKDKPKRPLSAYNIFFMEERQRILIEASSKSSAQKNWEGDLHTSNEKASKKTKKTPHRKIGFEDLAKLVGDRWKKLTPERRDIYQGKAEKDSERYAREMEEYKSRCL